MLVLFPLPHPSPSLGFLWLIKSGFILFVGFFFFFSLTEACQWSAELCAHAFSFHCTWSLEVFFQGLFGFLECGAIGTAQGFLMCVYSFCAL